MKHEDRQLAMFKDKSESAHRSWERVYANYINGQATKESLVSAMEICNCTDKELLEAKSKPKQTYRLA